jgi:hypothetical protein
LDKLSDLNEHERRWTDEIHALGLADGNEHAAFVNPDGSLVEGKTITPDYS